MENNMKKCPYCAEMIDAETQKCPYCFSPLVLPGRQAEKAPQKTGFADFFTFKVMITPLLITIIFLLIVIFGTCFIFSKFGYAPVGALCIVLIGFLVLRVIAEFIIVQFKILDIMRENRNLMRELVAQKKD